MFQIQARQYNRSYIFLKNYCCLQTTTIWRKVLKIYDTKTGIRMEIWNIRKTKWFIINSYLYNNTIICYHNGYVHYVFFFREEDSYLKNKSNSIIMRIIVIDLGSLLFPILHSTFKACPVKKWLLHCWMNFFTDVMQYQKNACFSSEQKKNSLGINFVV